MTLEEQIRAIVREELARAAPISGAGHLLTTDEAAELLGMAPKTIRTWVASGRLRVHQRRGRRIFLRREDVMEARSAGGAADAASLVGSLRVRAG